MRKLVVINIFVLLALWCATGQTADEVNFNAYPKDFFESLSPFEGKNNAAQVNFYVVKSEDLKIYLNRIVVLPANYQQKFIDCNQERYRAQEGFKDEMTPDSLIKWVKAMTDRVKERNNGQLPGEHYVIIRTTGNGDESFKRWGGKAYHDTICDSLSNIVANEFFKVYGSKIIPPTIKSEEIFDSIYSRLDDGDKQLWDAYIYPQKGSNSLPIDDKKVDRLSNILFNNLDANAYVTIDVIYNKTISVSFKKDPKYEIRSQMYCKVSIFGPGFKVLWSSEFPISKRTKKAKYAYEIIDYKMANKNAKRTLALLRPNKISN